MNITKLTGIIPARILDTLTPQFLTEAGIDGPKRLSHFLGQCKEETGQFTRLTENLNYSADALIKIFPTHFTGPADAAIYNRQPEKIANRIYANRMGNGDEVSGDGWKYRGEGCLQLTGKNAFKAFGDWVNSLGAANVDLVNHPEQVATAPYDLLSAAWFFTKNNLWVICDRGVDMTTVTAVTRKVNGGVLNLDVRYRYTQEIYAALIA